MNELMTFLLPANGMDWFFLVLLVGWAVFAMYAAAQAKKSIDIRITSSHFKNIKSSAHDLSIASRHPVWDHIVDNAPGFALVLGLLGTFLGIGLAIQGAGHILADLNTNASDATDIRKTIGNLSPMLAEIGLKFKSSAWGIITHIFLRVAIPAFGIEEKRLHEIFKELESDYDDEEKQKAERWAMIESVEALLSGALFAKSAEEGSLAKLLVEQNSYLNKMTTSQKNVESMLSESLFARDAQEGSLAKLLVEQNEHLSDIATAQKDFGKLVKSLGTSVSGFEKTVGEFQQTVREFQVGVKKSMSDMQISVQQTSKGLQDAVESMKTEVRETFGRFEHEVSSTLGKVGDDIRSSSLSIKEAVDSLQSSVAENLKTVGKVTSDLSVHSQQMVLALKGQEKVLDDMGNRVEKIAQSGAKYANTIADLTASDGVMVGSLDALLQEAKSAGLTSITTNNNLEKILLENRKVAQLTEKVLEQRKGGGFFGGKSDNKGINQ